MVTEIPFRLKLDGDLADDHQFQGYDGYMALAGFAWILSLTANYLETGKIRHRGEFQGRSSVRGIAPADGNVIAEGSIIADFSIFLAHHEMLQTLIGTSAALGGGVVSSAIWDLIKNLNRRHLGSPFQSNDNIANAIHERHNGDFEALVAATESAIRQTHQVIGNGAQTINVYGGNVNINTFNTQTKRYVNGNVEDRNELVGEFSVSAFNVNSGYGSVFDAQWGRVVPIKVITPALPQLRQVFTWGLDEYARRTGRHIQMKYWRVLAMDDTPKRYMVLDARILP